MLLSPHAVVQLTGLVKVTSRYFFDWAMSFFQQFDNHEKTVCKMGQTGHAEFIRLLVHLHTLNIADTHYALLKTTYS